MAGKSPWNDDNYVKVYELAKTGLTETKIAKAMGVTWITFKRWREKKPAFKNAIEKGKGINKQGNAIQHFHDYVYQQLPPDLQVLYDKLDEHHTEENGVLKVEALLAKAGKNARQQLFLYALTAFNFNASRACQFVNIPRKSLENWLTSEPGFVELMNEMKWHQANLFESGLIGLVQRGDTNATIFANKTYNRDRGYNEKLEIEHMGSIQHNHAVLNIDKLDLPMDVRTQILEAYRDQKSKLIEAEVQ